MTSSIRHLIAWFAVIALLTLDSARARLNKEEGSGKTRKNGRGAGPLDEHHVMDLVLTVPILFEDELDAYIEEVSNSSSPKYGQYLTSHEFKSKFCPSDETIANITSQISKSLIVTNVSANNLLIHVRGRVKDINTYLNIELHTFFDGENETSVLYHAPRDGDKPSVPHGVNGVIGLSNRTKLRHHVANVQRLKTNLRPNTGSGPTIGMIPSQVRKAYSLNANQASQQTVALVQFATYTFSDLVYYHSYFGLAGLTVQTVVVSTQVCSQCCYGIKVGSSCVGHWYSCNCYSAGPTYDANGQVEVTLDCQMVMSIANIKTLMVYEAPNTAAGSIALYTRIATDNQASVVSSSWGTSEENLDYNTLLAYHNVFRQMAAQGQTMLAASGDDGAFDNGDGKLSVDHPASDGYVVAVGGTTLRTVGGSYSSESAWWYSSARKGGGGGVSAWFPKPSFQSYVNGGTMRYTPDVSLLADPNPGYAIYVNGQWTAIGGTSASTPIWAALIAIANQARANQGKGRLGLVNNVLYSIMSNSYYAHDVRDGSTNGYYRAVSGYDLATGWGSFQGDHLIVGLTAA